VKPPPSPWEDRHPEGLVLRPWRPAPEPRTLVSCTILRSRDVPLWLERAPSWRPGVDRSIVVLGSWSEKEPSAVIEGASKQLTALGVKVILPPAGGWPDQIAKRSAYFARLSPGEVAFIVDADEELVEGPEALRQAAAGAFDVGWLTIEAHPRYERVYGQPRLFLVPPEGLLYRERHHWVFTTDGRLVAGHSYGGTGWLHERVPLTLINQGGKRLLAHRRQVQKEQQFKHSALDSGADKIEPLFIAQVMRYDAGLAAYRLHSAINSTTRERSLMLCEAGNNPLAGPLQYDLADRSLARGIMAGADILHCHLDYTGLAAVGGHPDQPVIIHHHGTMYRRDPERADLLDRRAALRLASTMNLLLLDKTGTLQWLPNPVPVALYRRMAAAAHAERQGLAHEVWIAHSPSKPKLKGTGELLAVVERLRKKRLKVRLQLTMGVPHAQALWTKAACDLCFDSFWLGIQVSGLEAAAMGQPVLAGDQDTADEYVRRVGSLPYTFVTPETLEEVLERLVVDADHRAEEAARVGAYVLQYHDEPAVARRYLELVRAALAGQWRRRLRDAVDTERKVLAKALRQDVKTDVQVVGTDFRLGPRVRSL